MKKTWFVLLLAGCASLPEHEAAYARAELAEQWELCKMIYKRAGAHWYSHHPHRKHREHKPSEIRSDLALNNCSMLLRRAGLWSYD